MAVARLAEEEICELAEIESLNDSNYGNIFSIGDCPTRSVTVYLDKAEVSRVVRTRVIVGENEITIRQLSHTIDKDSVRVEVRGAATISDVQFCSRHLDKEKLEQERTQTALKTALVDARRQNESLQNRLNRLSKQRSVLESFADTLIGQQKEISKEVTTTCEKSLDIYDPKRMETLNSFFDLYDKQASKLDEKISQTNVDITNSERQIQDLEKKMKEVDQRFDEILSRELIILLDSTEAAQVELVLNYVVTRASWTPKYDIRVHSNENIIKMHYYGLVQQSTGEDWRNTQIFLSTSQPGIGGTCPDLGIQKIHFRGVKNDCVTLRRNKMRKTRRVVKALSFHATNDKADRLLLHRLASEDATPCASDDNMPPSADDIIKSPLPDIPTMSPSSSQLNHSNNTEDGIMSRDAAASRNSEPLASTQFEVPRLFTIVCNGEQHKVTIGIIDLQPTFEYETVPKKSPFVYLKANARNTSQFALLAGNTNIYVDNSFVSKGEIKAVAPQEDFDCHLGVDHGIKVAYRPMYKMKDASALGSKVQNVVFRQLIELKNAHAKAVRVLVIDQLPISIEDKLKVNLLEPIIKHPEKYDKTKPIRLSKTNNVEWDVDLQPSETKEIVLKYTVEHPIGESFGISASEA